MNKFESYPCWKKEANTQVEQKQKDLVNGTAKSLIIIK